MDNRFENAVIAVVLIISFGIYAALTLHWNPLTFFKGSSQDQQANLQALEEKIAKLEAKLNNSAPAQQGQQMDNSLLGQSMEGMTTPEMSQEEAMKSMMPNPDPNSQQPKIETPSPTPPPSPTMPTAAASTTPAATATSTASTTVSDFAATLKKLQDASKQATYRISEMQSYITEANTLYSSDEDTQIKYNNIGANFYDDRTAFKNIKVEIDVALANNRSADFESLVTKYNKINGLFDDHKKLLRAAQSGVGTQVKTNTASTTPITPATP